MSLVNKNKRPSKKADSPAGGGGSAKKKRPGTPVAATLEASPTSSSCSSPVPPASQQEQEKTPMVFKDPNFVHSSKESAGQKKTRIWKNLRQIVAAEKALPWKPDDVTYSSLEAPPSFKPAKKYSDLTGLEARYTDPHTKIRYATTEEYARIRMLPSDVVGGYLSLRKANLGVP